MKYLLVIGIAYMIAGTVDHIELSILQICTQGLPQMSIAPWPNNPIVHDTKLRRELAEGIAHASAKYQVPWGLLVAIAYRENSFGSEKVGALGEVSPFQIIPRTAAEIRKYNQECQLQTVGGSAMCAAILLKRAKRICGDWKGALTQYATGKSCLPYTRRLRWLVKDRLGIARILQGEEL